jgi:acyl CoA:acetate/3-ketoacid CoA transferase alpha subunit/acyl CoA:acetate/3-ketoacid CoA transferase beta subunit
MTNTFGDFRDKIFRLDEYQGKNKILQLHEAIDRYVKPGMTIHISDRASALTRALIRQFYGAKPDFTLVAIMVTDQLINLIYCGLVKKLITSNCSEALPTPGPSRIIQDAIKSRALEIENWTLLSLAQRLMAGALDLPFMPTKSVIGSSIAAENQNSFCELRDPFGTEARVGLVKALSPDLSLIHGWASDPEGNIITAPYLFSGEDAWGAKASKYGVVATVECIVPTQFMRKHSALVTIPGYMVNSVSPAPLGAHPLSMATNFAIPELEPYDTDYEFVIQRRRASQSNDDLDNWIKTWVLDCPTHEAYLSKLGSARVDSLKRRATAESWKENPVLSSVSRSPEYNSREMMVIAAARKLEELVCKNGYKGILFGIGISCLAAYVAYHKLKQERHDVELWLGGAGFYGFSPQPSNTAYPCYGDPPTILTSKMISDVINTYGIFIGGRWGNSISVLSAAEVDKYGNVNSTKTFPDSYLIGAGGSNDAVNAREVLLMVPQSPRRLVEKVHYVTCPGERVKVLVTDMAVFHKMGEEFVLTHYLPHPSFRSKEEAIEQIRRNCGWELKLASSLVQIQPPSLEELVLLRTFDPGGHFIGAR